MPKMAADHRNWWQVVSEGEGDATQWSEANNLIASPNLFGFDEGKYITYFLCTDRANNFEVSNHSASVSPGH